MAQEYTKDELADWFENLALTTKSGVARNRLMAATERYADINSEFVGNLYFFRYDPKQKLTLPLYDKYPLAIVLERYNDGFLGLNLHYLGPDARAGALSQFGSFQDKKKINKAPSTGRGTSNWDLMVNYSSSMRGIANKTVHRYLFTNVRSQFIRINPDEYDKAVQLPIDEWVFRR
jgi:hypothetical protein